MDHQRIARAPKHTLGGKSLAVLRHFTGQPVRNFDKNCKGHVVYRFFSAKGSLLYVGVTNNLAARCSSHRLKPWWSEVYFASVDNMFRTRLQAERSEAQAIEREHPLYNKCHNTPIESCSHGCRHDGSTRHRAVGLSSPAVASVAGI